MSVFREQTRMRDFPTEVVRLLEEGARSVATPVITRTSSSWGAHEVRAMLASPEYEEIRRDYDDKRPHVLPLRPQLAEDYESQCRLLFSGPGYPSFDDLLARFEGIRELP